MAGFFGLFNYSKEGPGVLANAPPKGPFALFFEILSRKFFKIVTINLMYVLFSLPALFLAYLAAPYLLHLFFPAFTADSLFQALSAASTGQTTADLKSATDFYMIMFYLLTALTTFGMSYIVVGPVLAGVTYLLRNYAREEHAFVWMDFKESAKANFKQSMATCALSIVALALMAFDYFFFNSDALGSPVLQGVMTGVVLVLTLIITLMLMYVYPMMVTFRASLAQIYRNAFLLAIGKFLPNLGILLLNFFLLFLLPILVAYIAPSATVFFTLLYFILLAFGLTLYITNFYVYRQLKRFMVDRPVAGIEPPHVEPLV